MGHWGESLSLGGVTTSRWGHWGHNERADELAKAASAGKTPATGADFDAPDTRPRSFAWHQRVDASTTQAIPASTKIYDTALASRVAAVARDAPTSHAGKAVLRAPPCGLRGDLSSTYRTTANDLKGASRRLVTRVKADGWVGGAKLYQLRLKPSPACRHCSSSWEGASTCSPPAHTLPCAGSTRTDTTSVRSTW